MAGSAGSRLWPLSIPEHPTQFIDVLATGRFLLKMTVERFSPMYPVERNKFRTRNKNIAK